MNSVAKLFDALIAQFGLGTDLALAEALEIDPCNLSRLRHQRRRLTDALILCIHDEFGVAVADIKAALGMKSLPLADCFAEGAQRA